MNNIDFKKYHTGFTLIEMMIVVAIIGILAAIAYPSYQRYVQKGNRVEARNLLQTAAQRMETNFTVNRTYAVTQSQLDSWLGASPSKFYDISFVGTPAARSYKLEAVPKSGTVQEKDECGTFVIDERNIQTVKVNGTEKSFTDELSRRCWTK